MQFNQCNECNYYLLIFILLADNEIDTLSIEGIVNSRMREFEGFFFEHIMGFGGRGISFAVSLDEWWVNSRLAR
jgi:hypothetical protein